jgi:two-component system, sensor histidine kinase LadS
MLVTCVMRGAILILLLFPDAVLAQTVLKSSSDFFKVEKIYHFRTNDPEVDIQEVQQQDFDPLPFDASPTLGFDDAVHWFRFDLLNRAEHEDWYIEVAYPQLDHVEVYSPDKNGDWSLQFYGDLYPVSARPVRHRNFVFPVIVRRDITSPVIVKVITSSSVQVPLTVWSPEAFHDKNIDLQFFHGAFFGIMLIMILYNLLLYFSIRDVSTLHYVVALIAGANIIAFLLGYGFLYVYPESPEWNALFAALSAPFFIIASIILTRSFLGLKNNSPKMDKCLLWFGLVTVVVAILTLGKADLVSYGPLNILSIIDFILILIATALCFSNGFRAARLFFIAWIGILVLGSMLVSFIATG